MGKDIDFKWEQLTQQSDRCFDLDIRDIWDIKPGKTCPVCFHCVG